MLGMKTSMANDMTKKTSPASRHQTRRRPKTFKIDKSLAAAISRAPVGGDDDLLNTPAAAVWLGVSTQWLELGRCKKFGPPFIKITKRLVRYRKRDLLDYLQSRTRTMTAAPASAEA
jgi:hypothetical protein